MFRVPAGFPVFLQAVYLRCIPVGGALGATVEAAFCMRPNLCGQPLQSEHCLGRWTCGEQVNHRPVCPAGGPLANKASDVQGDEYSRLAADLILHANVICFPLYRQLRGETLVGRVVTCCAEDVQQPHAG